MYSNEEYKILFREFSKVQVKPVGKYQDGRDKFLIIKYDERKGTFTFNNSYEIRDELKSIGFKYDKETKSWVGNKQQFLLAANKLWEYLSINDRIKAFRFGAINKYTESVKEILSKLSNKHQDSRADNILQERHELVKKFLDSEYAKIMRKYQIEAVERMINAYVSGALGFILGDEQGLGKTLMSIAFLHAVNAYGKNVLVLTKKSLVYNYHREILEYDFYNMSQYVSYKPKVGHICIMSVTSLSSKLYQEINSISWDFIVFDEVQSIKDIKGKRARNFINMVQSQRKLGKKVFILAMTGTLIKNRTFDAYNITKLIGLHNMSPIAFIKKFEGQRSHYSFRGYKPGFKYYNNIDPEAVMRFREFLESSGLYIRRTKDDVIKELPSKNRIFRTIDMDSSDNELVSAISYESDLLDKLEKNMKLDEDVAKMISYYRSVIGYYKVDYIINYLEEFEDLNRLIIFAHHNNVVEKLYEEIRNKFADIDVRLIYGKTPQVERDKTVEAFQGDSDEKIWLIISFAVGSEGLTLTKANNIVFAEVDWSISVMLQAEDRIHRISQTKTCNYYYYIALNTLDQYVYHVLYKKSKYLQSFTKEYQIFENDSVNKLYDM